MTTHVWKCDLCGETAIAGEGREFEALKTHTMSCPALAADRERKRALVAAEERRERQRIWSRWLDEHFGPGADPLHLEYGDDREVLAELLAQAVRETPIKDHQGWHRVRP